VKKAGASPFPSIGAPAIRALESAGIKDLHDLTQWSEADLLALHGMGPKAVGLLRARLADEGLAFRS
jgi:predicted Fe-Mo cluster-binding NifX family protein